MSLIELCQNGDLEGVKAALKSGADVNTKDECGETGLFRALRRNRNSVVDLLLKTPNIDVNSVNNDGLCAVYWAAAENNIKGLKLLLSHPNIDVNIADSKGRSAVHMAGLYTSIDGLMLLLSHQSLTAFTLNQKYNNGDTSDARSKAESIGTPSVACS